jgi:DNA-binding transcriptional ArsR family regulator
MPGKRTVKPRDQIIDPRLIKVLAHPLRVRILAILEQRVASPSEIAGELEASLGVVSYHVRRLEALGLIKLVRKTPRRGAVEHYYRADAEHHIPDEAWAQVPDIVRRAMAGATLGEISARVNAAAAEGGFSRDDAHLSLTKLALDEQGWKAISRELAKTLERVDRIQVESHERLRKADHAGECRATVSMMLFESADAPAPADGVPAKKRRVPRARSRART